MGLVTGSLPNLLNGVSQQPPALRATSQHEALVNAWSSLVDGLGKRPPTRHVAKINALVDNDAFVHIIDRDATEKYAIVIRNGAMYVYDLLTGAVKTLTTPDGTAYLNCTTPRTDFAAVTIADHTFIVNKTVACAMGTAVTGGTAKGSKQTFAALPAGPVAGDVWRIEGDNSNAFDDYYVKWDAAGVWVESTPVGITYQLDNSTMPHKLVRNADGTWTFQRLTWDSRLVGDAASNPDPSFIGKKISDIFFHRNRLGVCSDEGVILSRSGQYYDFFAETVTEVLDSDPIDFTVAHAKVSLIRWALSFSGALLLFSDKTQFQMNAEATLTPKTVTVHPTTEFEASRYAKPVAIGQDAFFAVERGDFTSLREYYVDRLTLTNDADDVTSHVPKFIPKNTFKLAASTSEDAVVALSLDERNSTWVYKYYWQNDKKMQAAWAKFSFDAADVILGCEFVSSKLYYVVQRADGMHIEYLDLQNANSADLTLADGSSIVVHLDRRTSLTGVYNAGTGLTTWTLPYADAGTFVVVLGNGFAGRVGERLVTSRPNSTTITAVGDYHASPCFVGRAYTFSWKLSEQFVRDQQNVAQLDGRLQMRAIRFLFSKTGYFTVQVTPPGGTTYTYPYTGQMLGASSFVLGKPAVNTGEFLAPVYSDSSNVSITVLNDSHLPCLFQTAEWTGFWLSRAHQR